jgi:crotonobetainyl-CoA:carnitine CoA-transferase CaiB-like acyl-CoA transferase
LALEGVRVIDFTHFLAGPFATLILADMGADVLKIENPGRGEEFRHFAPLHPALPAQGGPFLWGNRNKRSVAIDLKNPQGLAVVRDLIATADVVIENFSAGVMDKLGLGYAVCQALNPRLVYCAVSAYGREGEFADRLGFDPIVQAESGFMDMNGFPDREGTRTLSPVIDIHTATMASNAILGALLARGRTGVGQFVEVSLFDDALLMTGYAAMQYLMTGDSPARQGNISSDSCPTGLFRCQDKAFYMMCGNDKMFQRFVREVMERPDWADDARFADRQARLAHRTQLLDLLGALFVQKPWAHWQGRMRAAGVPCGEVRTLAQALDSAEARARQVVTRVAHPRVGWVPNVGLPIRYSGTPLADPVPAPAVGQHTEEVLRECLGYDAARLSALREAGALGGAPLNRA